MITILPTNQLTPPRPSTTGRVGAIIRYYKRNPVKASGHRRRQEYRIVRPRQNGLPAASVQPHGNSIVWLCGTSGGAELLCRLAPDLPALCHALACVTSTVKTNVLGWANLRQQPMQSTQPTTALGSRPGFFISDSGREPRSSTISGKKSFLRRADAGVAVLRDIFSRACYDFSITHHPRICPKDPATAGSSQDYFRLN
jgi:hypothetical protein